LDIIAGNWGLNSEYQASSNHPVRMYYGDFSDRGALDLIEAVYDPMRGVEVPRRMRDALASAYPPLVGKFPTHKAYSKRRWSRYWRYCQTGRPGSGHHARLDGLFQSHQSL